MTRVIHRHSWYFAFATTTLAVAVGVNLVVFTVVNSLWLRSRPFPHADRIVTITGYAFVGLESPVLKSFEAIAGQVLTTEHRAGLRPQVALDRVGKVGETLGVTPDYFRLFGLAIKGRDFIVDDDRPGAEPVAIISDRLWSRAFGRSYEAIGAVAQARPFPIRIIGVAPPHFEGGRLGERADVWIPSNLVPRVATNTSGLLPLMVFVRLHPGQTPEDVKRNLRDGGGLDERTLASIAVVPIEDAFGTPDSGTIVIREGNALAVVAGLSMIVLLGACATLATLVLVHYERRRRELAARIALGASRWNLAVLLSGELGVLAATGTGGAILVAVGGLSSVPTLSLPGGVDLGRLDLSIDWRVLGMAAATTVLTLFVSALLPLSRFTHARLGRELLVGPAPTASLSSQRLRQTLIAVHVSATVVVLVAAGLFVRIVIDGFGSGPGFDVGRTIFATIPLQVPYPPRDVAGSMEVWRGAIAERTARLVETMRLQPGVDNVAIGIAPIGPDADRLLVTPTVIQTQRKRHTLVLGVTSGSPELLPTLGIPILVGRGLTPADTRRLATPNEPPVPAVVTSSVAGMLWPNEDPVGQVFSLVGRRGGLCVAVGIARDFTFGSLTRPAAGVVITAEGGGFGPEPRFVIRAVNPDMLIEPIRNAVSEMAAATPWVTMATGRDIIARDLGRQRVGAWFFSGFGLTALVLGIGGVFGLVAYLAESRQREFGVRLALGATSWHLVRHGLAVGLIPVALGALAGLVIAAWISRLFSSMLVNVSPLDPLTYASVAFIVVGCAATASLGAVWRLRQLMPIQVLDAE